MYTEEIQLKKFLPNNSVILTNSSFYQGFMLGVSSNIEKLSKLKNEIFSINSENIEYLSFKVNIVNNILQSYGKFYENYFGEFQERYQNFKNFQLYFLALLIVILSINMITAIYIILKIRNILRLLYRNLQKVSKCELNERKSELNTLENQLKKFKQENYFEDFMGYRDTEAYKMDHSRVQKHIKDRNYCFKLTFSILTILIFYSIKVLTAFTMIFLLRKNVNSAIWVNEKFDISSKLIYNQIILFNGIKQSIIFGKDSEILGENPEIFLEKFNEEVKKNSKIAYEFSKEESGDIDKHIYGYLQRLSNTSLCENTKSLENYPKYCEDLDNKIPTNGLTQAYLRVIQYLDGVFKTLKNKKFEFYEILENKEYLEFGYTFENVYVVAFMEVQENLLEIAENFFKKETNAIVWALMLTIVLFLTLAYVFVLKSYKNMVYQVDVGVFGFQAFSIHTVVHNRILRFSFLKVYGLRQREF